MIQLPNKEISGETLHLSFPLVQPRPRDERCDGQIVTVLTLCGMVNVAARARISSTSLLTSWNYQGDLWRVISLQHDSSGIISIDYGDREGTSEFREGTSDFGLPTSDFQR